MAAGWIIVLCKEATDLKYLDFSLCINSIANKVVAHKHIGRKRR